MTLRIRVVDKAIHAQSFSLLWMQRLYVGKDYYQSLPMFARRALIAHECAHLDGHHTEWRVLAMLCPLAWPFLRRICHWQEYRADARAAAGGHTHGLLHLLCNDSPGSLTHPKNMDRRNKLMHSRDH